MVKQFCRLRAFPLNCAGVLENLDKQRAVECQLPESVAWRFLG